MLKIRRQRYWSTHTHSEYSVQDAMGTVEDIVTRARELGYRGLAMTDHGNIAASVELYQNCRKNGIKPFPGSEMYLVEDRADKKNAVKRYHFCVMAYTTEGYRNLVHLSTLSHENFFHKPIVDLADLARLAEEGKTKGLALTTGCYFGYVIHTLREHGPAEAKRVIKALSQWFDTYVEIQRHRIDANEEDWISDELVKIADELGLPLVLGQDSHYTHSHHQEAHDALKRMVSWSASPDEAQFPGDGFHMVDDQWMIDHHGQEVFDKAMKGHDQLLAKHDMYIEEMEEYAYRIPSMVSDPEKTLREITTSKLFELGLEKNEYLDRLQAELDTVSLAGMSDYFILVNDVCAYMREEGIEYQTRGSAAGSLIAYTLGITNVDPIKWGTSFDRFMGRPAKRYSPEFPAHEMCRARNPIEVAELSEVSVKLLEFTENNKCDPKAVEWLKEELTLLATNDKAVAAIQEAAALWCFPENPSNSMVAYMLGVTDQCPTGPPVSTVVTDRKSPPDIDLDVDNQRRGEVLEWLNERYSVVPIGNWSEMGFKSDATGTQSSEDTGSIVVKYISSLRKQLRLEGNTPSQIAEAVKWEHLSSKDKGLMQRISDMKPFSGAGTHACGIILCNSQDEMDALVPKMWIPNKKALVSQYNMGNVEGIGLVKLDLLGSKTVSVMARAAKDLGYKGIEDFKSASDFGYANQKVYQAMGKGQTSGVFQLEGYSSMMGVKDLKPRKIADVVAAMALFRPATMDAGATEEYMERRWKRWETPERHKIIQDVIGVTNGVLLYQDQIIDILRSLGMNPDDLTTFLKAVKASNKGQGAAGKVIEHYMPIIHKMCTAHGINEDDWKWLEYAFQASVGYGFNKAHATVYGITAYLTQWMQLFHPDVFYASALSVHIDAPDKVSKYEAAARSQGVRLLRADVAESAAVEYRVARPNVVRRPLQTIKGVGAIASRCIEEIQPIKDFDDFQGRVNSSKVSGVRDFKPGVTTVDELKGVLKALYHAGALNSIGGVPIA